MRRLWIAFGCTAAALAGCAAQHRAHAPAPTLFIAGDSTAAKGPTAEQQGWGELIGGYFDPAKLHVVNAAHGGRSSRTFITGGDWQTVAAQLRRGDFVLLQFGHNDGGALNVEPPGSKLPLRARGTLPGVGEEMQEIDNVVTGRREVVHSFGWYLRQMIGDTRRAGATPIVMSLTGRNEWRDGRVECGSGSYRHWDAEVARAAHADFIDLSRIIADRYQRLGEAAVRQFFTIDHLHTNPAGAEFNAAAVLSGLESLRGRPFAAALSPAGLGVPADRGQGADSVCDRAA